MTEELKQLREALRRVKHEAASLADAQVIAPEALAALQSAQPAVSDEEIDRIYDRIFPARLFHEEQVKVRKFARAILALRPAQQSAQQAVPMTDEQAVQLVVKATGWQNPHSAFFNVLHQTEYFYGIRKKFPNVSCSQCGCDFGPGNEGFSHCADHQGAQGAQGEQA